MTAGAGRCMTGRALKPSVQPRRQRRWDAVANTGGPQPPETAAQAADLITEAWLQAGTD